MSTPDHGDWGDRSVGRVGTILLLLAVVLAPAWLFADRLRTYRLHSDDFAYLASSRTLDRAWENLFQPHNTHIVPVWRMLTWAVSAISGRLENLQNTLTLVSYGTLVVVMLLVGRLLARESGRAWLGIGAMIVMGTTSVLESSATWYSSGQTLWASLGILAMLYFLQDWRFRGGGWRLAASAVAAWVAGGFWTIGHAAGPVGALYLWADGRKRCRVAAIVPMAATSLAVILALGLGARQIDSTISFHGRTVEKAINLTAGAGHTLQAIPENLVLQNLGIEAETTPGQGVALTALIAVAWLASLWRWGRPRPIETSGATLVLTSYYVEWIFRGYLPFSSLRGVVPWYDTIPQVGAVLFGAGWIMRVLKFGNGEARGVSPLSRKHLIALLALQWALVGLHQPRVDRLFERGLPAELRESLEEKPASPSQKLVATRLLAEELARRQRLDLARLDQAEVVAREQGIDREAIRRAFRRVLVLEIPKVYDAADLLILPNQGRLNDPEQVRKALGPWLQPSELPIFEFDSEGRPRIEPMVNPQATSHPPSRPSHPP